MEGRVVRGELVQPWRHADTSPVGVGGRSTRINPGAGGWLGGGRGGVLQAARQMSDREQMFPSTGKTKLPLILKRTEGPALQPVVEVLLPWRKVGFAPSGPRKGAHAPGSSVSPSSSHRNEELNFNSTEVIGCAAAWRLVL